MYAVAGFRRYATYRPAMVAAIVTNSVFGFLRSAVLLAVVGAAAAGCDEPQLLTYVWAGQGLIGVVLLWAPIAPRVLRRSLPLDGAASAACGALLLVAARPVSALIGLDAPGSALVAAGALGVLGVLLCAALGAIGLRRLREA